MGEYVVEVRNLHKIYPDGTVALRGVSLGFRRGEVHVVLGENGAGKTTLARIVYGEVRPSRGQVLVEGVPRVFRGPWEAIRAGISMVYQHFSLVHRFTVAENLFLYGHHIGLSRREVLERVEKLEAEYGLKIPLNRRVDELPAGLQQRIEIVKALLSEPKLLILDEPTSLISPLEAEALFKLVKRLKEDGVAIMYITHRLKEVPVVGDVVTVMRRGEVVKTIRVGEVDLNTLARLMVGGREIEEVKRPTQRVVVGERVLEVERLTVVREGRRVVDNVSFWVSRGEILGIAGVVGNGQEELVEAIFGLLKPSSGRIVFCGRDVTGLPPWERLRLGMAFLPSERRLALIQDMNLVENMALMLAVAGRTSLLVSWSRVEKLLREYVDRLGIVARSLTMPVKRLSGGNQQKLALARIMALKPRLLVAVDPTHGLDYASTMAVRRMLRQMADNGTSILLVSSDLDELLQLSDRLAVMYSGKIVSLKPTSKYTYEELGRLMGGYEGGMAS